MVGSGMSRGGSEGFYRAGKERALMREQGIPSDALQLIVVDEEWRPVTRGH